MLEVETFTIYKVLKTSDLELYSKLKEQFFTGYNLFVFKRLEAYYLSVKKLPTLDEFEQLPKGINVQNYFLNNVKDAEYDQIIIDNSFLIRQLDENRLKRDVLENLDQLLGNFDILESGEVKEAVDNLAVTLNSEKLNAEEFFDASEIDMFPESEDFILYPTGLSNDFDSVNGGFALQELILLGGRRGSGKSILTLNALRARYEMGHTVVLFSAEMRYKEQYNRLMSMVSQVPFLSLYKGTITKEDSFKLAEAKIKFWYKDTEQAREVINQFKTSGEYKEFDAACLKLEKKDNRFIIIDQVNIDLPKINYYMRMISQKYPNFTMSAVDYLNIVKITDRMNWQSQITIADTLKEYGRTYNTTMISPYQMDADGEARFAKGILDSADKSLIFLPADQQDQQQEPGQLGELKVHTAKIRNGRPISFSLYIDWSTVRVHPEGRIVNEQALPAEKYGSDSIIDKTGAMDLIPV